MVYNSFQPPTSCVSVRKLFRLSFRSLTYQRGIRVSTRLYFWADSLTSRTYENKNLISVSRKSKNVDVIIIIVWLHLPLNFVGFFFFLFRSKEFASVTGRRRPLWQRGRHLSAGLDCPGRRQSEPGPREGLWLRPTPPSPGAGYNNPALYQKTVAQPEEGGATQRVPEEATSPLRGPGDKPGEKVVSARGGRVGEERSEKRSPRCCHPYCIVIYF